MVAAEAFEDLEDGLMIEAQYHDFMFGNAIGTLLQIVHTYAFDYGNEKVE